jgi:hypothetical protein
LGSVRTWSSCLHVSSESDNAHEKHPYQAGNVLSIDLQKIESILLGRPVWFLTWNSCQAPSHHSHDVWSSYTSKDLGFTEVPRADH